MRFARQAWDILTEPEALTVGTGRDQWLSVAAGKIVFERAVMAEGVWILPADTDQGHVTGSLGKLTAARLSCQGFSIGGL